MEEEGGYLYEGKSEISLGLKRQIFQVALYGHG